MKNDTFQNFCRLSEDKRRLDCSGGEFLFDFKNRCGKALKINGWD